MTTLKLLTIPKGDSFQDAINRAKKAGLEFGSAVVNTVDGSIDFPDALYRGAPVLPSSEYADEPHPFLVRFYANPNGGFATIYDPNAGSPSLKQPAGGPGISLEERAMADITNGLLVMDLSPMRSGGETD
jgi:hypothetical protein